MKMKGILATTMLLVLSCSASAEGENMEKLIEVKGNAGSIIYRLNNSTAADDLWNQLPMTLNVDNFSTNEKIFYPGRELRTVNTPLAEGGSGTLAYYRPWGNIVMFYDRFSPNSSLYELGEAISGEENIGRLTGRISVHKVR